MYSKEFRLLLFILGAFYLLFLFISPTSNFYYDQYCWVEWTKFIHNKGLGNAYDSFTNYSPAFLYVLKFYGWLAVSDQVITDNIHYLRNIVIIFDIAGIILAARIFQKFNINPLYSLLILFNVGYLYNTAVWGQVDCVYSFFAIAAIYFALNGRIVLACVFAVCSYNLKLQSIIFMQIIALLLAPHIIHSGKKILTIILSVSITELIIFLPFIIQGHFNDAFHVSSRQVDAYPMISMHAFNLWYLLFPGKDCVTISDSGTFLGITYKKLGVFLFFLSSFIALLPLILNVIKYGKTFMSIENLILTLRTSLIISITFFFFNTQMHERYSHPAIILAGILFFLDKNYTVCILLSAAYVLNMEYVIHSLRLTNYNTFIFNPSFIASLYCISLVLLFIRQYRKYSLTYELNDLFQRINNLRVLSKKTT